MTIREAREQGFDAMHVRLDLKMRIACKRRGMGPMEDVIIQGFESVNGERLIESTVDYHERVRDFANFVDGVVCITNHVLSGGSDA